MVEDEGEEEEEVAKGRIKGRKDCASVRSLSRRGVEE